MHLLIDRLRTLLAKYTFMVLRAEGPRTSPTEFKSFLEYNISLPNKGLVPAMKPDILQESVV